MRLTTKKFSNAFIRKLIVTLICSHFSTHSAHANETFDAITKDFRFSGFGTLGLTYNDNGGAGAIYNYSQTVPAEQGFSLNLDSVLGLQLEWKPLEKTSFLVQGVGRAGQRMEPLLRMAYVRQELGSEVSVRGGRFRNPMLFDSDVNEVGYAYMMSRPPIALYSIANNFPSIDGVDLQWRHSFLSTAFLLQGYYGNTSYQHRFYNLNPVVSADAQINNMMGVALSASRSNITVRASRTWVDSYTMRSSAISQLDSGLGSLSGGLLAMTAYPQLAAMSPALISQANQISGLKNPFDNRPIYTSVGFDAYWGAFRFLGEWVELDSQNAMVGKYEGFQTTIGYTYKDFTPYVSFANLSRNKGTLNTSALNGTGLNPMLDAGLAQMQAAINQSAQFANLSSQSISAGTRWDVMENLDMKLQYDFVQTPNSMTPGNFAVSTLPFNNHVSLVTLALDFIF